MRFTCLASLHCGYWRQFLTPLPPSPGWETLRLSPKVEEVDGGAWKGAAGMLTHALLPAAVGPREEAWEDTQSQRESSWEQLWRNLADGQVSGSPLSPIPLSQEMIPAFSGQGRTYREGGVLNHPRRPYPRKLRETQLSSPSQIKLGHNRPPHPQPVLIGV